MRDLPNPSLIDTQFIPDPFEDDVPSGWVIGLVMLLFVGSVVILECMRFYYD